ncbi:MAG: ATP-binding protein [Pseudobdellovibrionaceae bacterium]|nr:ATP-binding protein [Pseudobdellovibrionaceae bacterium]
MKIGNALKRKEYLDLIDASWKTFPIVALIGARQVGKTTLARAYGAGRYVGAIPQTHYFDLEDPLALARLANPRLALESLKGLIVIDEIQRMPELFPVLRVLADDQQSYRQFLILGSASLELIKGASESLAGRIRYIDVHPFDLSEVGVSEIEKLWVRGGYPRSFLAASDADSILWRESYVRTFLERDIPQLGFNIAASAMRRFWMMLSHVHGQILNHSDVARSLDISDATVRRYLDILEGTFMVRRLQPWHANISKRQVKAPKVYFRDSGLLHHLWGIPSLVELQTNPKLGASWEGFAMEELLRNLALRPEEVFFWAVHQQAELDLLTFQNGRPVGYEIKYTENPKLTKSMLAAKELLALDKLYIVYPGSVSFPLANDVEAIPLGEVKPK